ncbi:MAG: APA family basic amino acid/polyamine antiporter [Verrucomicrobiales bacterium]|jgi:APA family basic amino acid/polyamine antiporter
MANQDQGDDGQLRRTLSLPLLILYGLGVTIGAGIFALVGEILASAGSQAPMAFLVAGVIAGLTGISYMALVAQFPRAGGEAVYVRRGIGALAGRVAGLGVVVTGVVSSAVVSLAFAGYVTTLISIPERLTAVGIVIVLCGVAWWGVRESVILAAVVTLLELGTLILIVVLGLPHVEGDALIPAFDLFADGAFGPVLAGAGIAFFAFIGFEDIANMAEETIDPRRAAPRAIAWTLGITLVAYVSLALIATSLPNRAEIAESSAPMTVIFSEVSGLNSAPIATIASFAMINGILVQIVMASRVLYGMATDGQLPRRLAQVNARHRTPSLATFLVGAAIIVLAVFFPLVTLAKVTSVITLSVFTLVNVALVRLVRTNAELARTRWLVNGLLGAMASAALGIWQAIELF